MSRQGHYSELWRLSSGALLTAEGDSDFVLSFDLLLLLLLLSILLFVKSSIDFMSYWIPEFPQGDE